MTYAAEFQVLSDTLYYWSVYEPECKCELGCAALKLPSGWVAIDPAPLAESAWKQLLALAPLRAILLTNGNHVRDTPTLRKQHGVPVVTLPETRRDITELRPEITLLPGEMLYGITPIAIPGATAGETAYFSNTGVLIVGDAIINTSAEKGLEFLPEKYCTDAKQNRESLKKLLAFDFHTLVVAHGPPLTKDARARVRALLES